jgi:hypothetical protein
MQKVLTLPATHQPLSFPQQPPELTYCTQESKYCKIRPFQFAHDHLLKEKEPESLIQPSHTPKGENPPRKGKKTH